MALRTSWQILQSLLDRLPEVRVVHGRPGGSSVCVSMYVGSRSSLLAIARCSAAANAAVRVEDKIGACRDNVPAPGDDELRFVMDIDLNWIPEMGTYLLRELVSRNLVDPSEAAELEGALQDHYRNKEGSK
jgi:hypothetical protein